MTQEKRNSSIKGLSLVVTFIIALLAYFLLSIKMQGTLSENGCATIAMAILMAGWWITEALPISATALVPIAIFPILGIAPIHKACAPYAHKLIFLFLGGFLIAIAMQRWDLHRRFALIVLRAVGRRPSMLIAGFMGVAAFLSMWVSNTATVVMMLPIGLSVIELVERQLSSNEGIGKNFSTCLMLGLAYAASIGGIGTLIGTPPNALLAAFIDTQYGQSISFSSWTSLTLPIVILFLPIAWLMLTRIVFPIGIKTLSGGQEYFDQELKKLGPMKSAEWKVLIVFCLTAFAWISRPLLNRIIYLQALDDTGIAMIAALTLFIIPSGQRGRRILNWKDAKGVHWGVLILFGGGLSLAAAMQNNGVTEFIAHQLGGVGGLHPLLLMMLVATTLVLLTEITSNTATAAAFLPILGGIAVGVGLHPYLLLLPATVAVSCAFMLPVATPPNALVFASERVTIPQMCKAGVGLIFIGVILITLMVYFLAGPILGIDLGQLPSWAN